MSDRALFAICMAAVAAAIVVIVLTVHPRCDMQGSIARLLDCNER